MPDTFANPAFSGLDGLAKAFMVGPSEGKRVYEAEHALKLQREREGRESVGDAFTNWNTPNYNRAAAVGSALRGGVDPSQLAVGERYLSANQFPVGDPRVDQAFVGAGGAYGSTPGGFRENEAGQNTRHTATLAE